jgi:hypothetical protein
LERERMRDESGWMMEGSEGRWDLIGEGIGMGTRCSAGNNEWNNAFA